MSLDYGWGQGFRNQNLYDAIGFLQASTNFPGTAMAGGSTLDCDSATSFGMISSPVAFPWNDPLPGGQLFQHVTLCRMSSRLANTPFHPEAHNLVRQSSAQIMDSEARSGGGRPSWARGNFVNACQGQRLGYADDWDEMDGRQRSIEGPTAQCSISRRVGNEWA